MFFYYFNPLFQYYLNVNHFEFRKHFYFCSMKETIIQLAKEFETTDFINGDPSWFMHQVEGELNKEALAFVASCFSYGSRKQFLPKIQSLLDASKGNFHKWIKEGIFRKHIANNDDCFYRLYTNRMVLQLLNKLQLCYEQHGSMKQMIKNLAEKDQNKHKNKTIDAENGGKIPAISALEVITDWFQGNIVPKNTASSCKRLCMFLRWMVRTNSPVDLGLWSDIIDRRTLIMPLDTHVMQQANRLALINTKTTSMATALKLTKEVAKIFPEDPLKADFALFGYGVNSGGNQ